MMSAADIIKKYISFFEKRGHVQIPNSPLVPFNDPSTLFTNSGMQPLIPYLAGEVHPQGKRFVNVQNCFRGQGALDDINEVGDNRHLTFFRMLGNWSLGDYFKKEQIVWMFEFLTKELQLDAKKLYVSVFEGYKEIPKDTEAIQIWTEFFENAGLSAQDRIFEYGVEKNWWSRVGIPDNMPAGELGGPDSEIFYDFGTEHDKKFGSKCHINCECGRFLEISNNVFMQYKKASDGSFEKLPQQNVDHGSGAERFLMAVENQPDVFLTSLFKPVIEVIEKETNKKYEEFKREMRMITAHLSSASFIVNAGINPSNTEQGYILRRLIRRASDSFSKIGGKDFKNIIETIIAQYESTDSELAQNFEKIQLTILEESMKYQNSLSKAKSFLVKKYPIAAEKVGDDLLGATKISSDDAFIIYTTHGLSPSQIKSLGFIFDEKEFAEKMKTHKNLSKKGAEKKFKGGLADTQELTIRGHTATHLMHQAIRDVLGNHVFQRGSNITTERVRFDFNFDRKLTSDEIEKIQQIVREKIKESLPVSYKIIPLSEARKLDAIGLFGEKYADMVKIYSIGESKNGERPYSVEFCGGPHVTNTSDIKSFTITREEGVGRGLRRIYAIVE